MPRSDASPRRSSSSRMRHEVLSAPQVSMSRALTASARNFRKDPVDSTKPASQLKQEEWHRLAWEFYDNVGEYRYSIDWKANLASRATLYVTKNGVRTDDAAAVEILDALYGGPEGQSEMLRQLCRHYEVAGDCYLIGQLPPEGSSKEPDWLVAAAVETKFDEAENTWRVFDETFAGGGQNFVQRLWRPHPRLRRWADSPTRAVLPVLAEIDGLTKHVAAQIDSRLAGAGILFVPNGMTFGSPREEADQVIDPETNEPTGPAATSKSDPNELVKLLIDVMSTAIQDRSDPSAHVPIVIQAEGEEIKNVRFEKFSSDLDDKAIALRTEAIRRMALGLDMPPEVLTGTADMNHWSSWQVEEAALKAHTEPLLEEIANALTIGYLRPTLDSDDADEYAIAVDTSQLRVRPNRSKESIELWDRGIISMDTVIIENGFELDQKMSDQEKALWLLAKVAGGSATPDQVQAALELLGVHLVITPGEAGDTTTRGQTDPAGVEADKVIAKEEGDGNKPNVPADTTPNAPKTLPKDAPKSSTPPAKSSEQSPRQSRPAPSTKSHPSRNPPAKKAADTVALAQAGAVMVHRALERSGNRMKTLLNGAPIDPATNEKAKAASIYRFVHLDTASTTLDSLLEDAWGAVEVFADDLGVEPWAFTVALDSFTRDLLTSRKPLRIDELTRHLQLAGLGDG